MPGKVFISCGQATEIERVVAREVATWFTSRGFEPYVATQVQSIPDLNRGIIGELKSSDYYLFINFRREPLAMGSGNPMCRGSLYTNQELAVAYALGFDQMLFLNQRHAERAGMFGTIVSNSPEFETCDEVLPAVKRAVESAAWLPSYSRHLVLEGVAWSGVGLFNDNRAWLGFEDRPIEIRVLHGRVANRRPDVGATGVVARLQKLTNAEGRPLPLSDQTLLKVTNEPAFEQTLWPASEGRFDLLAIDAGNPVRVFLMSRHDRWPRLPIVAEAGTYRLRYQVLALEFPSLDFKIEIDLNGTQEPPVRIISG